MKSKKRNYFVMGIVALLVVAIVAVLFQIKEEKPVVKEDDENSYRYVKYNDKDYRYRTNLKTILFLGIDTKDPKKNQGQSDAIDLAIFDRDAKKLKIVTLSRDAMVDIRLFDAEGNDLGYDRQHLALAYANGKDRKHGGMLAMDAVSKLLDGIPVINYAAFDLNALQDMQDIVGNMTMVLDANYTDIDPLWKKGKSITITRNNVEKFIRTRDTSIEFSNKTRMQRQKLYIQAYTTKLKQMLEKDYKNTVKKMYNFYNNLTTNITLKEIDSYADMILNYSLDTNQYYSLPGKDQSGVLHDEFIVDNKKLKKLIIDLFYEEDK